MILGGARSKGSLEFSREKRELTDSKNFSGGEQKKIDERISDCSIFNKEGENVGRQGRRWESKKTCT